MTTHMRSVSPSMGRPGQRAIPIALPHPAPAFANVGRSSQRDELYLNGSLDRPARSIHLTLRKNSGNVATGHDGVEIHIKDGKAWGREIGSTWQKMENISGAFAPGGGPLAFLATIENVRRISESATRRIRRHAIRLRHRWPGVHRPLHRRHVTALARVQPSSAG